MTHIFLLLTALLLLIERSVCQQNLGILFNDQPPAGPNFENHGLAREMVLLGPNQMNENDLFGNQPQDVLIGPDGSIAAKLNRRSQIICDDLTAEKRFIEYVRTEATIPSRLIEFKTLLLIFFGCFCIVGCGVAPAFLFPAQSDVFKDTEIGRFKLNMLLSFAVGSLLGDVFLHLLPEAWADSSADDLSIGLWCLCGLLICFIIEKCCAATVERQRKVCALMNLVANFSDNFTHGLSVAGSFFISHKLGMLTTFAIVIHELPHEISDFAILLRANFAKWSAVRAQLTTALGGFIGAVAAVLMQNSNEINATSQKILAFTAGSFLNIALAQILPDLLKEANPRRITLQLVALLSGILIMAAIGQFN